jgi:hypothetical protein
MRRWYLTLAFLGGCTCGVPAVSNFTFPCNSTGDCASGFFCSSGSCVDAGTCDQSLAFQSCVLLGNNPVCCPVATGFACLDLQGDPSNCGACGIVCPSGSCISGQCTCAVECPGFATDAGRSDQLCGDAGVCFCTADVQCGGPPSGCTRSGHCGTHTGD